MPVAIHSDFQQLKDFISEYSLSAVFADQQYIALLSRNHKKYFALLTCLSELTNAGYTQISSTHKLDKVSERKMINFTNESISDLGSALFNWMHGCYKPTRMLIRGSIENFTRGICVTNDTTIADEIVASILFERAAKLPLFAKQPAKSIFGDLKSTYGQLCADVHSSTLSNMQQISALNYFPGFDATKATDNSRLFTETCQRFTSILCLSFREFFFNMHPTNVDIILQNLPRPVKSAIYNPESV